MISIILVTRNAMPFVVSAVRQARECELRHSAEVIAIDGGSTDGTWEVISENESWNVHHQDGEGLAAARNQALARARGKLIAFLDADDVWMPGKLSTQLQVLDGEPDTDVVSCMLKKIGSGSDEDGDQDSGEDSDQDSGEDNDQDSEEDSDDVLHSAWTPSGCLFRRRAFDRVGLFDTRYQIACDHDWFVRARQSALKMTLIDECLLHKRIHRGNLSHNRERYREEFFTILRNLD
ncbi:MAG: glycosyltransferase family 2 protein [Rhodothermia bacterium]